jgi:hypothetical protein
MSIRHFSDIDWQATVVVAVLMLLGTALFAWALSLRFGSTAVDTTTGETRPSLRPQFAKSFFFLLWPGLFIAAVAASLVAIAAASDTEGLYGQTGAAWMQAAGSVVAIVAVIILDQLSSQRLRQDRRNNERDVSVRRLGAILQAAKALEHAAVEMRAVAAGSSIRTRLSPLTKRKIEGAGAALEYLTQQGAELEVYILAALCLSQATYKQDMASALSYPPVTSTNQAAAYANQLEAAAEQQRAIFQDAFSQFDREWR